MVVEVELEDFVRRSDHALALSVCDSFGTVLGDAHSQIVSRLDMSAMAARTARCVIEDIRLVPGDYSLTIALGDPTSAIDAIERVAATRRFGDSILIR